MKLKKLYKKLPNLIKRVILAVIAVTIIGVGTLAYFSMNANAAWYDTSYAYRKPVVITNSSGGILTNLQYLVTVDTSSHVQSGCPDIRFVDSTNKQIPYYIDSGCGTSSTKIWLYLSSLATGSTQYYMYYGNPNAVSASSSTKFDNLVGLEGYWTMNETSGTSFSDYSVNGNSGAATGGTVSHVTGEFGDAAQMLSNVPYITVTNNANMAITGNTLTVTAWVQRHANGSMGDIVDKDNYTNGYEVDIGDSPCSTNQIFFDKQGVTTCLGSFPANTSWHFVEVVVNGSSLTVYIDGVANATATISSSNFGDPSRNLSIGGAHSPFDGQLDDVHVYNTARSSTQAATDYANQYTIQTEVSGTVTQTIGTEQTGPQPMLYWKFNEGTGTTVNDSSSTGVTGTLSGSTTKPTWQTADQCIANKCLFFDGSSAYVSATKTMSNIKSIGMWIKPISVSSGALVDLDGGTTTIKISSGSITTSGFTSPTIYVNGNVSSSVTANKWQYVEVTTNTGVSSTNPLTLGKSSTTFFNGFIDEVKFYPYTRTATQVANDYTGVLLANGGNVLGAATSVPTNGLVGYWKMDENTGTTTADSSGNGQTGTLTNSPSWVTGKYASGIRTSSAGSSYVSINGTSTLSVNQYTVSFWMNAVNPADGSGTNFDTVVFKSSDNFEGANYTFIWNHNQAQYRKGCGHSHGDAYPAFATIPDTMNTNTWYYVTCTYDGTTERAYLNGKLESSVAMPTPDVGTGNFVNKLFISGFLFSGLVDEFNGTTDDVRVYNRALSQTEIQQLYNYAPGPAASYNFEEGTGSTVNDTSGNSNTGTWNGTLGSQWTAGKYGKGGNFNGTDNYIVANDASTLDPSAITVEGWVKFNTIDSAYHTIAAKWQVGVKQQFVLQIDSDNKIAWWTGNGTTSGDRIASATTPVANKWYYITATITGTTKTLYINGVQDATGTGTALGTSNIEFTVGGKKNSGGSYIEFFNGQMDQLQVYNYARTPSQVIQDMNAGHPLGGSPVGSEVGWWKFDEGYGITAHNSGSSGSTLNGSFSGSLNSWTQNGKFGKAITFGGSGYVFVNNNSAVNPTGDMTLSAWINLSTNNALHEIAAKYSNTGGLAYRLYTTSTGKLAMDVKNSTTNTATGTTTLSTGTWYHVVGVYSAGNSVTVYVNGKQDGQTTSSIVSSIGTNTDVFTIGADISGTSNAGANYMNGTIDEVKLFGGAMTAQDVLNDYNRGSSQVLGATGNNSSSEIQSTSQLYCIPGDTASCSAPTLDYEFEEKTGSSVNDTSGNGHTGTWHGTLGSQWTQGKIGSAANFNGTDTYIDTGAANSTLLTNTVGTIEAWIYPTGSTASGSNAEDLQTIVGDNAQALGISRGQLSGIAPVGGSNGQDAIWVYDWAGPCTDESRVGVPYIPNQWIHISWVKTGGNLYLYKNGTLIGSTPAGSQSGCNPGADPQIGASTAGGAYFNGRIDQVRYFNYARSGAQVAYDYNRGAPVAWWKFDECQGSSVFDSSGNGNTGTWAGGTSVGTCNTSSTAWGNGATGKFNSSLSFNGTNDFVTTSAFSPLAASGATTTALSWGGWFYPTTSAASETLLEKVTEFHLTTDASSHPICGIYYSAAFHDASGTTAALALNTWNHVVCTYDGINIKTYVNGQLVNKTSNTNAITAASSILYIAESSGATQRYSGQIDDVRIYDYSLTPMQVQQLYNQGAAVRFGPSSGTP